MSTSPDRSASRRALASVTSRTVSLARGGGPSQCSPKASASNSWPTARLVGLYGPVSVVPPLWMTKNWADTALGKLPMGSGVLNSSVVGSTTLIWVSLLSSPLAAGYAAQLAWKALSTAWAVTGEPSQNLAFGRSDTRQVDGSTADTSRASQGTSLFWGVRRVSVSARPRRTS